MVILFLRKPPVLQLLGCLGDLALPLDDAPQRCLVPLIVVGLLALRVQFQVLLDVLLDGDPAVVDVHAGAEYIDFLNSAVLLQNHADQRHGFAGLAGAEENACAWNLGHHGVRGMFASVFSCGKASPFVLLPLLPKFEAGKPGGESVSASLCSSALSEFSRIKLKAGMHLKYMGSKSWLAPHMDRLLGDVAVLHSPFGSGKLEYYLAARRPALEVRLRARRKPAALLLEARPGLPALLAAPGGAEGGQELLLQSPSAGHSERPCRASGRLLIRPAAQQLLGKVGLLHTAARTKTVTAMQTKKYSPVTPLL